MEKYKKDLQKQNFKISGRTWNEKFELPDGYSECIIKKHETVTDNSQTYFSKIFLGIFFNGIGTYV